MKKRYIFLCIAGIVAYNLFLIQRDEKLFKAYYQEKARIEQSATSR